MTKRDSPFSSFRIQIAHSYKEGLPIRCFVRMRIWTMLLVALAAALHPDVKPYDSLDPHQTTRGGDHDGRRHERREALL